MKAVVRRSFVDLAGGQVHYGEAGRGRTVLLLHQTPRSWAEYAAVLPLLGETFHAVAMDTVGFGDSYRPGPGSIEGYAQAAIEFLDALGVERVHVVGHHTGGVIAIEVAARVPDRVDRLVCSSTPLVDDAYRRQRGAGPRIDHVEVRPDGSHLRELWQGRASFYPPDRSDLLSAYLLDALKAGAGAEEGHRAVAAYRMEERLPLVRAPVLVLGASDDPFAFPHLERLAGRLPGSRTAVIEGGMVPLPDQLPEQFAAAVLAFLQEP